MKLPVQPKTDWTVGDSAEVADFARIYLNQQALAAESATLLAAPVPLKHNALATTAALPVPSALNQIEGNLAVLNAAIGAAPEGALTWPLARNPDFTDANRWERHTAALAGTLSAMAARLPVTGTCVAGGPNGQTIKRRV